MCFLWPRRPQFKKGVIFRVLQFFFFLNLAAGDLLELLAALLQLPEGHGKGRRREGTHSPLPLLLEGLLVRDDPELPDCHLVGYYRGCVHRNIIPMKPSVSGHHCRPLLFENSQECSEGLNDVVSINHSPLESVVCVNEALRIEEGQHHLHFLMAWTSALIGL